MSREQKSLIPLVKEGSIPGGECQSLCKEKTLCSRSCSQRSNWSMLKSLLSPCVIGFGRQWLRGYSICPQGGSPGFTPWVRKIPWRRKWQPTPVFLPGESHGRRSMVGYSPQCRKESGTTEQLHFHFHFLSLVNKKLEFI